MIATRLAFGQFLVDNADKFPKMVVLDAEMSNSTFTNLFKEKFPECFVQCFIAEQSMISTALGLSLGGMVPVCATFAAFLTRAFDQIRLSQYTYPKTNLKIAGSHCGISLGTDGPSQMALEDLAMFGTIVDSVILYPSGEKSAQALTKLMLEHHGISYLRLTRDEMPELYQNLDKNLSSEKLANLNSNNTFPENLPLSQAHQFSIGGSCLWPVLPKSNINSKNSQNNQVASAKYLSVQTNKKNDDSEKFAQITLIGAGITLHECLTAQKTLRNQIPVQVLDMYSVKPLDELAILKAALETESLIVVEDHSPFGGLGSMVSNFLSQFNLPELKLAIAKHQAQNLEHFVLTPEIMSIAKKIVAGLSNFSLQRLPKLLDTAKGQVRTGKDSNENIISQYFFQDTKLNSEWSGVHHLAVREIPRSGSKDKLLAWAKIDCQAIVEKVTELFDLELN